MVHAQPRLYFVDGACLTPPIFYTYYIIYIYIYIMIIIYIYVMCKEGGPYAFQVPSCYTRYR